MEKGKESVEDTSFQGLAKKVAYLCQTMFDHLDNHIQPTVRSGGDVRNIDCDTCKLMLGLNKATVASSR